MRKDYFNLRKSKLLLLMLFALLAGGASPAWAQTTEEFSEENWPDGWSLSGSATASDFYLETDADFYSTPTPKRGVFGSVGSGTTKYIITPVVNGNGSFQFKRRNSSNGSVYVYEIDNGELKKVVASNTSKPTSWTTVSFSNVENKRLAIVLNGRMDKFTYTPGEEVVDPYTRPQKFAVTSKIGTSATLTWTAGGEETTWEIAYSTNSSANPDELSASEVNATTHTLTNLTVGNTYYVWLRSVYGSGEDEHSAWVSTSFTLAYSTPAPTSVDGDGITNVTFGTGAEIVNYNTSKSPYYRNNAAQIGAVTAGSEATVAITFNTGYTYGTVVWVDWNQNYEFEDSEIVFAGECGSTKPSVLNATFTVPVEQAAGNYRMRICAGDSYYDSHKTLETAAGADATPKSSYTVAQDYTLKVKEAAAYAMSISETVIDFGTVKNTTTTKTFTIINDGDNALTGVSVLSSNTEIFTVSETDFDIPADGSKTITVSFIKGVADSYAETITVSQANVAESKVINVTATYEAPAAASMAIALGEEAVGETVAFGNVGKAQSKTFTVENAGDLTLNVTIASSNTTDFTVSPASLEVAGGSSETFTVTFVYGEGAVLDAEKTANITVTPSNEGLSPVTFAVTGTRIEQWSEDFSGNVLPDGWERTSETYWSFVDGVAKGKYDRTAYYLTTPLLIVEGTSEALTFDYEATANYVSIAIQMSKDGGAWTTCSPATAIGTLNTGNNGTATITGLEAGNYKFRFKADDYNLDNFQGFKRNMNDPKLGVYTDAECNKVVATATLAYDFGFVTKDSTIVYYFKNDGTGTMTLDQDEVPAGFSAVLGKSSLAAGESTTLTITFGQISGGYRGGDIVVDGGDAGKFTVSVSGVMIDNSKLNLDFTTDNIPSTWTANSWEKKAGGYVEAGYSSTSMESGVLTATAGEQLVVVAKNTYSSSSYTFGVKYKKVDAESWSDLIAAANLGTSWKTLTATIPEAGDYLLQFTGNYAQIQHIYGLTEPMEPVMVVYDGEAKAATSYSFNNVPDDQDYTHTFTVKNEGKAVLAGLTATLSGEQASHYNVAVTGLTEGGVAANGEATITVTQLKDNLGSHEATLTISSTSEGIADFVIALSGATRDASKLYVDFEDGVIPATWTNATTNAWAINTQSGNKYLRQYRTATSIITTQALTVAADEVLTFDAKSEYSDATLTVRYTTDGGITWNDYATYKYNNGLTGTFDTKTVRGIPAGTVMLQFDGMDVGIDNLVGFAPTAAPLLALTEEGAVVTNNSAKEFGNLTSTDGEATYTLVNNGTADMVTTVTTTGVATVAISGEGEGITIAENTVTLAAGKSVTIKLTVPYAAPYGEKTGAMTLITEGWVGDIVVDYTATTIDPTAVYVDFADNSKPEGFYSNGWTYTSGYAANSNTTEAEFITSKLTVAGAEDVLAYEARAAWDGYGESLTVSYSADRKNWTDVATLGESDLTATFQSFNISGLEAGYYYLRFAGARVYVDNISGWHYATPVAEHDLYLASATLPEEVVLPEGDYKATVTVASLRADEVVAAELWIGGAKKAELTEQTITKDETKTFELTGQVPDAEGKTVAYVKVYNANGTVQTEEVTFEVAHTRTLAVTAFARHLEEGEAEVLEANSDNQITAKFDVTVQNTGSIALTPTVKIFNGETVVGTATADAAVAVRESTTITVTAANMSAGEGGELSFTAAAFLDETEFSYATPVTFNVTAAAPKFNLAVKDGDAVADGDAAVFGVVKMATTKTYTITNSGNKAMELVSIVAPEGFEATAVTEDNKNIDVDGTLDIDVTLKAEQGKKAGNLVITYKVDASTNKTFTLALSGRSVAADTWTVAFDDAEASIPTDWVNDSWQVASSSSTYPGNVYTYTVGKTLMTPRLAAVEGEELTFDVAGASERNTLTVEYSADKNTWTTYATVATNGEQSFIAPAAGNYYLRFTGRYVYLSNFVGFKLNIPEHDTELAAESVPATATQYGDYTATVTLKEYAGKAEKVTAQLYVGGEVMATTNATLTANGTTVVTLTWEPRAVIAEAVKAYIAVTAEGIDLQTAEVDLTVAGPYVLNENTTDNSVDYDSSNPFAAVVVNRTYAKGWNTVCLPFAISNVEEYFGAGAKVYSFNSYADEALGFQTVTSLSASTPYILYMPEAVTEAKIVKNVTIGYSGSTPGSKTNGIVKFQGTYAAIAAGTTLTGNYGMTSAGKISKAGEGASMKGFRGYFNVDEANAREGGVDLARLRIVLEDVTTGLKTVMTLEQLNSGDIYNLKGQRVENQRKGNLYIKNGKKVVK